MDNHNLTQAEFLLKFLVVGNSGVGKTCLLNQFVHKNFNANSQHTIGAELGSKTLILDEKDNKYNEERRIKLQIWDTAGQERFRSVTRSYYRGACGALLVYDISDRESYESVGNWLADAKSMASQHIVIILCGNKSDLPENQRQVTFSEAEQFASENGMVFFETSAKEGDNVEQAFYNCAKGVVHKIDEEIIDLNVSGTGVMRYGIPRRSTASGSNRNQGGGGNNSQVLGNNFGQQVDAKIDLLKKEADDALNKFKGANCC